MKHADLKQVEYGGMTMSVPELWDVETEEFQESDGQTSYSISISASGKDVRSIDMSFGPMPEGSDAYSQALVTFEEVAGEEGLQACCEGLDENARPILCFDFKGLEAHGFSLMTEENQPCFFFCVEIPQTDQTKPEHNQPKLLTVLLRAADNETLQDLLDFTEDHLDCEA